MMHVEYLLEWLANDPGKLGKGGVWRGDPAKAGPTGCMGDVGTHAFNILEFVSGQRCTALNARLGRVVPSFGLDDTDMLMLEFDGGADAMLWCSLAAPGHRNGLKFKIVGTKGTLEWRQEAPETLQLYRLGEPISLIGAARRITPPTRSPQLVFPLAIQRRTWRLWPYSIATTPTRSPRATTGARPAEYRLPTSTKGRAG